MQATVSNGDLFHLPAGPVGVAAVVEYGKQGYDLRPDPLALTEYYYSWKDSDGSGKRSHAAIGGEIRVPVLPFATVTGAGRFDTFGFAGRDVSKFTYNAGLEVRPLRTLLVRAAYGTAFRAPDLHYLFTGPGNTEETVTDYYMCAVEQPDDEEECEYGAVINRSGNDQLKPETSRTLTAGLLFSPSKHLNFSVDYYRISMSNQVTDLSADRLLRTEADCSAEASGGSALLDPNSALCLDALARIQRFSSGANSGNVSNIAVNPINVSREKVSGIDVAFRGSVPSNFGNFTLSLGHSHAFKHKYTQYDGDEAISKLALGSDYYIPRDKSNGSISWDKDGLMFTLSGTRTGKIPYYDKDAYVPSYTLFNATLQYDFTDHLRGSLTVRNLADKMPVREDTRNSYPYYNTSWYDSIGRSIFLQITKKIGGSAL